MKRPEKSMMNETAEKSRALYKSGVKNEAGDEIVVAVGYTVGGDFGYFICTELVVEEGKMYRYYDNMLFRKKENERTYQEVLAYLKEMLQKAENE